MLCYQYQRLAVHLGHTRSIALSGLPPVHSSNVGTIASEIESTSTRGLFFVVGASRSPYNCTVLTSWHLVLSISCLIQAMCRITPNSRQGHALISCWLSAIICDSMIRGNLTAKEQTSMLGTENCFLLTLPQILPEHNSDSCFHGILVAREPYKSVWSPPPLPASKNRTFATVREDWEAVVNLALHSARSFRSVALFRES